MKKIILVTSFFIASSHNYDAYSKIEVPDQTFITNLVNDAMQVPELLRKIKNNPQNINTLTESFKHSLVKSKDKHSRNVLHYLAMYLKNESTQIYKDFMLQNKILLPALLKQQDKSGWTPLHAAVSAGNLNFVEAFKNFGQIHLSYSTFLEKINLFNRFKNLIINRFDIEKGNDASEFLKLRDNKGRTALHLAVRLYQIDEIHKKILNIFFSNDNYKCDKSIYSLQDKKGNTILHYAEQQNLSTAIPFKDLFANVKNFKGKTAEQEKNTVQICKKSFKNLNNNKFIIALKNKDYKNAPILLNAIKKYKENDKGNKGFTLIMLEKILDAWSCRTQHALENTLNKKIMDLLYQNEIERYDSWWQEIAPFKEINV